MNEEKLFRSLVAMVAIDGEMSTEELDFLGNIRQRLNVSDSVATSALQDAKQGTRRVHLPKKKAEQKTLLELLVQAAYADGTVTPEEHNMLRTVAEKMGFLPEELKAMIYEACESPRNSTVNFSGVRTVETHAPKREQPRNKTVQTSAPQPARQTQSPSPSDQTTRQCPKCGYLTSNSGDPLFTGDEGHGECPACGIILRRYRSGQKANGKRRAKDTHVKGRTGGIGFLFKKLIVIIIVACPVLIFLFFLGTPTLPELFLWARTRHTVEVPAILHHVTMYKVSEGGRNAHGGGTLPRYELHALYTYTYEGKQYDGNRVTPNTLHYPTANRLLEHFKKAQKRNEQVPCYVNPKDPSIAVLDKSVHTDSTEFTFSSLLTLFASGIILYRIVRFVSKVMSVSEDY